MKRLWAIMMALAMLVCTAAVAEETTEETTVPFEDGAWVSVTEMSAEIYLPTGWTVTSAEETTFTAADADNTSTVTVTLEDFDSTDLAAYMEASGETYEMTTLGEEDDAYDAATITAEDSVSILYLWDETTLVRVVVTPATEGSVADNALAIADSFTLTETEEVTAE